MTTRDRSQLTAIDPLRTVPIVLIALFIVLAAVDLLLALQPALLRSLRASWESLAPSGRVGSPLPTLLAATAAISGIALSATLVAAFIRAVRRAPFTWLTPSLIGLWSVLISGVSTLPLPISTALFAGASALLLAGGGVLLQQRSRAGAWLGGLLLVTPFFLLVGAYAARGGQLDRDAEVLIVSQLMISCAVLCVALVTRTRLDPVRSAAAAALPAVDEELSGPTNRLADPRANGLEARLRDALLSVATSETRALQAEQRARGAEQRAQAAEQRVQEAGLAGGEPELHAFDGDGPRAQARRSSAGTLVGLSVLWLVACGAVGYFMLYLPMQQRLLAQQSLIRRGNEQKERAIAALQARVDRERSEFTAQRDQLVAQLEELRQLQSVLATPSKVARAAEKESESTTGEHLTGWRARRAQRLLGAALPEPDIEPPSPSGAASAPAEPAPPAHREDAARSDSDPIGGLDL